MCVPRATWAFVMTVPSLDQITPEPLPPAGTRTVERRSFSAISPNPVTAISLASVRSFRHNNAAFLNRAATNKFQWERLPDRFTGKVGLNVLQACDRLARH